MTIIWSGSDDTLGISRYETRLDSGSWNNVGTGISYTLTGPSDGIHTIAVKATDKVGNTRQDTVNFTVNTSLIGGPGWTDDIVTFSATTIVILIALVYILKSRRSKARKLNVILENHISGEPFDLNGIFVCHSKLMKNWRICSYLVDNRYV